MLVLSRRKGEEVLIGSEIKVTIVNVRGGKVRLGVTVPEEVPVYRREVYEAIQREDPPDKTGTLGVANFDDPK